MEYIEGISGKRWGDKRTMFLVVGVGILLVIAIAAAGVLYTQNRHLRQTAEQSSRMHSSLTNDQVAQKVASVYDAPSEKPSVAQVADKSKLSSQAFFQNAQKGDYVLIYPKAKIALIYRASTNKVVNIGPISTGQ